MRKKLLAGIMLTLLFSINLYTIPPRLNNFGLTCFLNATTQAVYATNPLTDYLLGLTENPYEPDTLGHLYVQLIQAISTRSSQKEDLYDGALYNFANEAYRQMRQEEGGFKKRCPIGVRKCPGECSQEDAREFLDFFLTSLIQSDTRYTYLSRREKLNEHPIAKLLALHFTETIHCPTIDFTKQRTIEPETYLHILIERDGKRIETLSECLQDYFQTVTLGNQNNYYKLDLSEEELQLQPNLRTHQGKLIPDCEKTTRLIDIGDVVVIVLKRFKLTSRYEPIKLKFPVTIPYQIDLGPYFIERTKKPQHYYELVAAVSHRGDYGSGHYIANVRDTITNKWYHCDDQLDKILEISWKKAKNEIDTSYIYVYQKNERAPIKKKKPRKKPKVSEQNLVNDLQKLTINLNQLTQSLSK